MMAVVFEHPDYGALPVANMIDIDKEMTDDIDEAIWVVCPLQGGQWLAACASEGRLTRSKRLN